MKTSRVLTLLSVLILSLVLVSAVMAGASSTRRNITLAEGGQPSEDRQDLEIVSPVPSRPVEKKEAAGEPMVSADDPDNTPQLTSQESIPGEVRLQPGGIASSSGAPGFASYPNARAMQTPPLPFDGEFVVDMDSERVWGVQAPGDTVTVTVNGVQMGAAVADGVGFFWTTLYDDTGGRPGLVPGDIIAFYVNGVSVSSVTLPEIGGSIDILAEEVAGNISDLAFDVTVYVNQPTLTSYFVTTTLDGGGNFLADFNGVWDFYIYNTAVVAAVGDSIEVHRTLGPAGNLLVVQPAPWNQARGLTDPGATVTVTLNASDESAKASDLLYADGGGWWYFEPGLDFLEGDYVVAEFDGGEVISRTIEPLSVQVDSANDQLTGTASPFADVRGHANYLTLDGWKEIQGTTVADSSGAFTIPFEIDIVPGWGGVFVADGEGDDMNLWTHDGSLQVNQTYDSITGWGPSSPGESEGRLITLTLSSTETAFIGTLDWFGWFDFSHDTHEGFPDILPGDVVTVVVEGYDWQGVVPVSEISTAVNVDSDEITGEVVTPTNRVEFWGHQWHWGEVPRFFPLAGEFNTLAMANSPYTATPSGFDLRGAVRYDVQHRVEGELVDAISHRVDFLRIWPQYNALLGWINPPGAVYTLTLTDSLGGVKATLSGESGYPDGFTGDVLFDETGAQIEPGDYVLLESAGGFTQSVHIPDLVLDVNLDEDTLSGRALANELLYVNVDGQGLGFVPTMANGDFIIAINQLQDFYGDGDLAWGDIAMVCHADQAGNHVCRNQEWPQITARYHEDGWNDVFGWTTLPENTIQVTVTDEFSGYIDSGSTMAGDCEWCGPNEYQVWFPDHTLLPGYRVRADFGGGFVDYVDVAEITGEYDLDTDIISGTVPPNSVIFVYVENEGGEGPRFEEVEIGASGVYSFNFGAEGWDILPGDNFHVYVPGRHNHQTEYIFSVPFVQLGIQKENTPGHGMPGHPILYKLRYWNDGNTAAEGTVITDTIPASTLYLNDTSGLPVQTDGNMITWDVGTLSPGMQQEFFVALEVGIDVPLESELEQNCAWIKTTSLGDHPEDNQSCVGGGWITEGDSGLWINKYPQPDDPHPGQEFEYILEYGSDGGVATGPAWITDTLPEGTEVVWWFDEYGWDALWTEVSPPAGEFALYAPVGVPGDMGGRIHLRLRLDPSVEISTTLANSVIIDTAEDVNPENNYWFDNSAHVGPERHDLWIEKRVHNQVPVPGGWLNYFVDFRNNGNVTTTVTVTDTLPDGVSFEYAHWGGGQPGENEPLPDPIIDGNQLIWELGPLDVNQGKWFHIQVNISDGLSPGDPLNNCVTIQAGGDDSSPDDNTSCVEIALNEPGPNLRVNKTHEWRDNGQRLEYRLWFENLGDETIPNVWLTDTLPLSTTWEGWWDMDFDWERLVTEDLTDHLLRWEFSELHPGDIGEIRFGASLDDPGFRPNWYTNTLEITLPALDINPGDNFYQDVAVIGELDSVDLDVNTENAHFWGQAQPGAWVTVTTAYTETYAFAEWDCGGCWDIENAGPVWPGEFITVTVGAGLLPVSFQVPDPFTTEADSDTEEVWGQIDQLAYEPVEVDLEGFGSVEVQTDENGNYSATFPDIPRDGRGEVRYRTQVNYAEVTYHNYWQTRDLLIGVNYAHDWVSGNYEAGRTIWLTVTQSDQVTVKGTAQVTTGYPEGWEQPGFSTQESDWDSGQPDIQPSDWVFAQVDLGYSTDVRVGEIRGYLDVDADMITGTVNAYWWLDDTVDVQCHPWGAPEGAPNKEYPGLSPDDVDEYNCAWDPFAEWDIQPGQDLAVEYREPDGDSVYNVFYEPGPYLQIGKGGNGTPSEGGTYAFTIDYRNAGEAPAESVVITDTLLGAMTYITDTSELPLLSTNPIVWDVGTLPPGEWISFRIFVEVTGSEGEWITNTAQIDSSSYLPGEPQERYVEWSTQIQASSVNLNVGKDARTGDPAAGEPFVWQVSVCNNGGTSSSEVTLTDTLPISTTLVDLGYSSPGWLKVYEDSESLLLTYPTIAEGNCEDVYLTTLVDALAVPGQQITNTVEIAALNDSDPGDNEASHSVWVGEAHTNIYTHKWWNWGRLVPGGMAQYSVEVGNNGNTVVNGIVITDTLPVSSTLVSVTSYDQNWNYLGDVTTTQPEDGVVVWDVGTVIPGMWANFQIDIQFETDVAPGTVLTNSVEVSPQPEEDSYEDNFALHVEEIYSHGPNLRIRKWGDWEDQGNYSPRAVYNLSVENVGDEPVMPVVITDTFPSALFMDGEVGTHYERGWEWGPLPGGDGFTATLEALYGGERTDFFFSLITDTEILPEGMAFTNTAEVTLPPEDPNPDDNHDSVTLTSGPDLFVNKDWIEGDPVPGEQITYAIDFGNDLPGRYWWWNLDGNAWLTDTLPAGTTYITSTLSWCEWSGEAWCPFEPSHINGDQLGWQLWPFAAGERYTLHLTVALTDTVESGQNIENSVEISSTDPESDLEYNYGNNTDSTSLQIIVPNLQASFDQSDTTVLVSETVYYTDTSTTDIGEIVEWAWDFGDETPKVLTQDAAHAFDSEGEFEVTLVVTDSYGFSDSYTQTTYVSLPCVPITEVSFNYLPPDPLKGETVSFTATITPSNASMPVEYTWDFGDSTVIIGPDMQVDHAYTAGGTYTVTLTARNACTEGVFYQEAVEVAEIRIYLPIIMR